jgi:hypothetical protein
MRERGDKLDPVEANRHNQQLFFADEFFRKGNRRTNKPHDPQQLVAARSVGLWPGPRSVARCGCGACHRGPPVVLCWHKRIWQCVHAACPKRTWTEAHPAMAPRACLTERARH